MSSPVQPLSPDRLVRDEAEALRHNWFVRRMIALDVLLNVWIFNGRLDETVSAHAGRAAENGKWYGVWACRFLNLFDSDHGAHAIAGDLARAEAIEKTEDESGLLPKGGGQ